MAPTPESVSEVSEDESSYEDVSEGEIDDSGDPIELSRRHERPPSETEVVVEAEPELELPSQPQVPQPQLHDRVAQILSDASTFRRARLPTKAIATLRAGLQDVPGAAALRVLLRDILLEMGRRSEAAAEMVEIAGLQIEELDAEQAVRTLQDVLAIEPQNGRAAEMLRALGYELVEEPVQSAAAVERAAPQAAIDEELYADISPPRTHSLPADSVPLPSYNLEEIDEPEVAHDWRDRRDGGEASVDYDRAGAGSLGMASYEPAQELADEIDDPFGDGPLPSFPLEAPTEAAGAALPRNGAELESALEEADFFASRGLYEDARTILDEQLARLPHHPLLLERLEELDQQEAEAQAGSGTRPSPAAGSVEDRAFDIAESLGALDASERVLPAAGSGLPTEQVDVEEVFAKFKEGVAKQIGADDAQSHYDLGLAYKDMGLLDDATREFETAARDPRRACVCHSMIGMIELERGRINEAIQALLLGLQAPDRTREQDASLSYELGAAFEIKKMNKQALEYFQRAARLIPGFRDVVERMRHLQKVEPVQPSRAVAVGADDEFDRAFADILGKGS